MATYSVTIQFSMQVRAVPGVAGFRLTAQVLAATGLSTRIFRYRNQTALAGQSETGAFCDGVCSAVDLESFPADLPEPDADPPYFRLAGIDMRFESQAVALEAKDSILAEIQALLDALAAGDQLAAEPPIILSSAS